MIANADLTLLLSAWMNQPTKRGTSCTSPLSPSLPRPNLTPPHLPEYSGRHAHLPESKREQQRFRLPDGLGREIRRVLVVPGVENW